MEFQAVQYGIDRIIQRVRAGRLALPDFQRDFVWNPSQVVDLLDSVARQWPIGALLLLSGPQCFATRQIHSGPPVGPDLDLYILDGQQRVTALFHAISNVSEYCYYVNFTALAFGAEDSISWEKRSVFERKYPTVQSRARNSIALISEVWELEKFYMWLDYVDSKEKSSCVYLRERSLAGLQSKVYKVMAIELDQDIDLEALARIFETLNRSGLRLNAFDLMVAALYPSGFHLRDEWQKALDEYPVLQDINPEAIEILKLIALLVRLEVGRSAANGVRQGDLLKIRRPLIQEYWPQALDLYVRALRFCRDQLGITSVALVPAWSMVLGVAAWLRSHPERHDLIRLWWLDRISSQHFAQAANTRIVSEFQLISDSVDADSILDGASREIPMEEPAKKNGILLRGLSAIVVACGGLDPLTGNRLSQYSDLKFRALTSSGELKRVQANDKLSAIVIVSSQSDKELGSAGRCASKDSLLKALESQGMDEFGERTKESMQELLGGWV